MIDMRQILAGLTQVIGGADYPDATALATAIDLDISQARVVCMKKGDMIIHDARLNRDAIAVDVICGIAPWRRIWLVLGGSRLAYRGVKDEIFGANQRVNQSRFSSGFGVLFEIDGWTCGYTASSPDGNVEALFCEDAGSRGRSATSDHLKHDGTAATEAVREEIPSGPARHSASIADADRQAHISCENLWQSDLAICGAAPIAEDPRFQAICLERARKRYEECLAGVPLSPLLPH